jgi:putative spermidine/putrescine transport system permease protein
VRGTYAEAALYLGPAVLLSLAILALPLGYVLYMSLFDQHFTLQAYGDLLSSTLFERSLVTTIEVSVTAAVASLLLGYPVALHLARQPARKRALYMILVLLPFWTSVLVKSYAFTVILGRDGLINTALSAITGRQIVIPMIFNRFGVIVGMTNYLVPFVVLPVLASLLAIDPALRRAAEVMGAKPARIFLSITLPLSTPGIVAALSTTTVMSLGFFVIPALLGGPHDMMMANLVDFFTRQTLDWHAASAIGMILLGLVVVISVAATRIRRLAS